MLADETVSSFEIENMQSDNESQRDWGVGGWGELRREGCVAFLRMPACASNIMVLHLITGADGSINKTSVCASAVLDRSWAGFYCVRHIVRVKTFTCVCLLSSL